MSLILLPSVRLDLVTEDTLDATAGFALSTNVETFALVDAQTLEVEVDGGSVQTVTFLDADFDDIAAATAAEIANVITGALTDASATAASGAVTITSDTFGASSSIEVTGGTAAATLGFPSGLQSGTDSTDQTLAINRNPEDGEADVPADSSITIQIFDSSGAPAALADIGITVEGVDAVVAGVIEAAFAGTGSGVTLVETATRQFVLVPTTAFDSDQVVDVEITVGGARPLSTSYSFTIADTVAPTVASAVGRDKKLVRVTFAEGMQAVSALASNDALNPANYYFSRLQVPSMEVTAVSVAAVPGDPNSFDVTTDFELTFGASYLLSVADVEDDSGNEILAPGNEATFTAYSPPVPAGRRFELIEFIPDLNIEEDSTEDLVKWISCLQEVANLLLCLVDEWIDLLDPDDAPPAFVDAMLVELGNPFGFELDEADARRLAKLLVSIYKQKGTEAGIINVVRFFLGLTITIDVYNGGGWTLAAADNPTTDGQSPPSGDGEELSSEATEANDPVILGPGTSRLLYTFDIDSAVNLTDEQRFRIRQLAEYMKPAHTHLNRITEPQTAPAAVDHLELGLSELGGTGGAGTFILHE